MKMSFNWLSEYIDLEDYKNKIEELSHILTQAGLEVEGLDDQKSKYNHVVVGQIKVLEKHPDADKLTLCQVDVGEDKARQIICGAKNHKQGDFIVAALPGAVLPGDFAIKKSKIRGVESLGMLCSEKELGLSGEAEGIITMSEGRVGQSFSEAFGFNDIIFELNVTPNRADCLSHIGLAHELSALLDRPVKKPEVNLKSGPFKTTDKVKVKLEATDLCPRYGGMVIEGIKVGPSPAWLKQRLEAVGVNSINNVVDVTNYVLFEYGQPLHAFDLSQIKGQEITVRMSKAKEKFISLDGTEMSLTGDELVISDQGRAVALAGVVGGQNSGVNDGTKTIFVESAFFTAIGVRRTSRRFGIDTDASYRFSRGVNPEQTIEAMKRACDLFVQLCSGDSTSENSGAQVASDWYDEYPKPIIKSAIVADVPYVAQRLGYAVEDKEFFAVMERLGCKVEGKNVTPPAHRWDLEIPEDLVEEYGRVKGYDHLGETLPTLVDAPTAHESQYWQSRSIAELLKGQGLSQVLNYAFLNKKLQSELLGDYILLNDFGLSSSEPIAVKNPVSEDFAVMRVSLLPSLFANIAHNCRHGNLKGQIFETANTNYLNDGFKEDRRISLGMWSDESGLWGGKTPAVYELKSVVENLLSALSPQKKWQWRAVEVAPDIFHPKQVVSLFWQGKIVGLLGSLHPSLKKQHKLRSDVALAEFNLEALGKALKHHNFKPISAYPAVEKDLAFVMPKSMKSDQVVKEIKKVGGQLLRSVDVVDVFEGGNLADSDKSLSFRMTFQSDSKTLSDEEVLRLFNSTIDSVQRKLSIQLR